METRKFMERYNEKIKKHDIEKISRLVRDHGELGLINLIKKSHRPTSMSPGTIGSYLAGCTMEWYGEDVDKDCSILCHGNLGHDDKKCSSGIWVINDKGLSKVSDSRDGSCLIFLQNTNDNTRELTQKEGELLWNSGCRNVKMLKTNFSKHYLIEDGELTLSMKPERRSTNNVTTVRIIFVVSVCVVILMFMFIMLH